MVRFGNRVRLAALTVLVVALAACSGENTPAASSTSATATPTSSAAAPVRLNMLHIDGDSGLDPAVDWFAERVLELSDGALVVTPGFECCGSEVDVEQVLVDKVAKGEAELGWVGARAFDELGVTSLRALTAPMLLDSYAVQQAVIEGGIAQDALADLSATGIEALALLPGAMRHPISAPRPLIAPVDWAGLTIYVFHSQQNVQSVAALGAAPVELGFPERDAGISAGTIQGLENTFAFYAGHAGVDLPYAVANVNLWPRISVLVAAPDALTAEQRDILTQAAIETAARSADFADDDEKSLSEACTSASAQVALATTEQLAAYRAAFEPVYSAIKADPAAAGLYDGVVSIKDETKPDQALILPAACGA
jgi:TRAP-type C4-dicarboxylate transport system substrate-binding protein